VIFIEIKENKKEIFCEIDEKEMIRILIFTFVIVQLSSGFSNQNVFRNVEICGSQNGHRRYLEMSESGEILASNITIPEVIKAFLANSKT
jgi:hypothetical protein